MAVYRLNHRFPYQIAIFLEISDPKFQPKFVKSSVFIGEILLFGL